MASGTANSTSNNNTTNAANLSLPTRVIAVLVLSALVDATYWVLWFTDRSAVASNNTVPYVDFQDAFVAADSWLAICLLAGIWTLSTRRPVALFWLLAGGGAGIYLFAMDVLYDIEHRVWWTSGAGGWIELAINAVTLSVSVGMLRWSWRRRLLLLGQA